MSDPPSAPSDSSADPSAADAVEKTREGSAEAEGQGQVAGPTVAADAPGGGYRVALPAFEGPLDLLLHLIEEHELDIRDIPIAFVAQKYVEYITLMEELNIDVASEYLVMAATLAYIKSRSLLPAAPAEETDEEEAEVDPRAELIRRLLEYQKYKHVAERLAEKDLLGRDVFPRGMKAPDVDGPAPLAGMSLFKLLDAFQSVLSRATLKVDHQIDFERFSISDRINEISDILRKRPKLSFDDLFEGQRTRLELILTFLALLEMTRLRLIRLFQEGPLETIYIELAVSEEESKAEAGEDGEEDAEREDPGEVEEDRKDVHQPPDVLSEDAGELDVSEPEGEPSPLSLRRPPVGDGSFAEDGFVAEPDPDRFESESWPEGSDFGEELEGTGPADVREEDTPELDPDDTPELEPDPARAEDEDEAPEREPQ